MPPRRRNLQDAFERQTADDLDPNAFRGTGIAGGANGATGIRQGNYNPHNKKYNTEEERRAAKRARDNARNARKREAAAGRLAASEGSEEERARVNSNNENIGNRLTISPSVTAKAPDTRDVTLTINKGDTFNTFDTDGVAYRVSPPVPDEAKTYRVSYDTQHNLGTFSKEPARSIAPYDSTPTPKVEHISTDKKEYPIVKDLPSPTSIAARPLGRAAEAKPSITDESIRVEEMSSRQLPRRHDFFDDLRRNYNRRINKRREAEDAAERATMNTISIEPLNITSNDVFDSNLQADSQRLPKQTTTTETGKNPKLSITKPTVIYDRTDTMNEFKDIESSNRDNADTMSLNEFYNDSRWNGKNNMRSRYRGDPFSRNTAVISTIAKMRYLNAMQQQVDDIRRNRRTKAYRAVKRHKKKH